jgi:hypothetical protein
MLEKISDSNVCSRRLRREQTAGGATLNSAFAPPQAVRTIE